VAKMSAKDVDLVAVAKVYKQESRMAKFDRMQQNKINFDMYHMRQDFGYKQKGQSREFLPKMSLAVEQNANFIGQGLVDLGDWFKVYPQQGFNEDAMKVKPKEVMTILQHHLEQQKIVTKITDSIKLAMVGSLMIFKVHGEWVPKPRYVAKDKLKDGKTSKQLVRIEDKAWQLRIDLVRQEDYYPDPTGRKLYEMQDSYMDYFEVERLAEKGIYDKEVVKQLKGQGSNYGYDQEYYKNRETNQNSTTHHYRNQVKITEVWGNVIDSDGCLIHENVMFTLANDSHLIQKPIPNPFWHGRSPFVAAPILTVPFGVWGKALMDAPAMLNRAINEMFNLVLDGGMMSVHGIKQIREHWLEDPTQVDDGITPGTTLRTNASCPPGATVLERVDTSTIPTDALNVLNLLNNEFFASALTNDLRMGVAPFRQVKATEIVEASQTITGMFSGMAKQTEAGPIMELLEKSWSTICQHTEDLDFEKLKGLIGSRRAEALKGMTNEELFAETVQSCAFEVFGISATLAKQKDFTKLQGLLQTVAASPILMEEFTKKYDFGKFLREIMESLDINSGKLESDEAAAQGTQEQETPQGMPDSQSQIPQAGAMQNQGDLSAIQQNKFPGSRANEPMIPNLGR
jgi:hypothetical protein